MAITAGKEDCPPCHQAALARKARLATVNKKQIQEVLKQYAARLNGLRNTLNSSPIPLNGTKESYLKSATILNGDISNTIDSSLSKDLSSEELNFLKNSQTQLAQAIQFIINVEQRKASSSLATSYNLIRKTYS